ncbi:MAG: hypothetical protein ACI3ZO_00525 [Candidatus Cryptobacteroides sp.]|nr:hypothetical protein [Bacteroidales bacterium]
MTLRDFKKDVEYFVGEFVDDCTLFLNVNPDKDTVKIAEVLDDAVDLYNDMKDRANAKVEKAARKSWFAGLRKEMFERVDALYERLSEIVAGKNEE